jgi:hypothetical protein
MRSLAAWYSTLGVGVVVGLLALALVSGLLSPVTVASHDYSQDLAADAHRASAPSGTTMPHPSPPPAPDPHHAVDPGRPLDQAAITAAIAKVPSLLPADATVALADPSSGVAPNLTPTACLDALKHDAAVQSALPTSADITRTYKFGEGQTLAGASLAITVNSYVKPKRDFADVRHTDAVCAHIRFSSDLADSGYVDATVREGAPPVLPYPAYRTDFTEVVTVHHILVINKVSTDWVLIGHNELMVGVSYGYAESLPTPLQQDMDQLLTDTLTTIIDGLRSPSS